jgi:phosphate-selective porin OprO/OprP
MFTLWKLQLRRALAGTAAACLLTAAVARAQAPAEGYYQAPDEVTALRQRLDAYETELREMRARINDQSSTQFASLADDKAKSEEKKDEVFKPAELITKPTITVFGRIFFDHIMYDDDPGLVTATGIDRQNETGFNTIRLGAKGNVYENVLYQVEVEFEGSETDFKDCYIEASSLALLGNVRVGHFKEPYSLEEMTSSRFITFMQRSVAHGAFVPSRNFGVMAYDYLGENEDISWQAGVFRSDSPDNPATRASFINDAGDPAFTTRLAWNPYYDEPTGGRYLLHLGGAYSYREDTSVVSFASRPELGTQSGYLSSTVTGERNWHLSGLELAAVAGRSSLQAEYYYVSVPGGFDFDGGYVQASYFLTGEHRGYKRDFKVFDRVKPFEDFFRVRTGDGVCCGRGAWELKARWSWVDLNEGLTGTRGYQDDITAGFNWYWNPYTRMMFDYVLEDVDLLAGTQAYQNMFGVRFQIDY